MTSEPPRRLVATIPGNPVPKARPRFANGRVSTPKRTKDYEKHVKSWVAVEAMKQGLRQPFRGPVTVTATFYRSNKTRVDIDNLQKALLDGVTKAGVWVDDSQVKRFVAEMRVDAKNPRVDFVIEGD